MNGPFRRFNDYDFRHWVVTQADAGESELVHRLFAHQDREGRNSWFSAREQRNEVEGYAADLERARSLADSAAAKRSDTQRKSVGLQCRYALMTALIRDLASNQRPELSARYVQAGMWSRDQALAWARLAPDPQMGLRAVADALRGDEGARRHELARLALDTGATILDSDNRVLAVARLAADLPIPLRGRALEIVAQESNEGSRLGGLLALAPHLPKPLRLEALRIAEEFHDRGIKAQAIAAVAQALEEPERSQAFRASLSVACAVAAESTDESALNALARSLPRDWLFELYRLLESESADKASAALLPIFLERLAEEEPGAALERVPKLPKWKRDDVRIAVVLGFVQKGMWSEAADAAAQVPAFVLEMRSDAWGTILQTVPEAEWGRWVDLFRPLSAHRRIDTIRGMPESSGIPGPLLRQLAGTLDGQPESSEALAAAARALSPAELSGIFETCLSDAKRATGRFTDLAAFLSLPQVRRALDAIAASNSSIRDPFEALLVRLAVLGEPDEAISRVADLRDLLESRRAEILGRLAAHVPDDRLGAIRRATRPHNVVTECARTRAALLPWLSAAAAGEIAASAAALRNVCDRVSGLSDMIPGLPAAAMEEAVRNLIAALPDLYSSPSLDRDKTLQKGFRALSQALVHCPSPEVTEQSISLACDQRFSAEDQIVLLLDLASAGGTSEHVRESLTRALGIAAGDAELASIFGAGLTTAHGPVLGDLLAGLHKPGHLVSFLSAAAGLLDSSSKDLAAKRVAALDDAEARLSGLNSLLRHLPEPERERLALQELDRQAEWSYDPEFVVSAFGALALHVPKARRPPADQLIATFRRLPARSKVTFAGHLAGNADVAVQVMQEAFAAALRVPERDRPAAMVELASWLDPSQIANVLDDPETQGNAALTESLARRAAELRNAQLVVKCLSAEHNGSARSKLIAKVAPELRLDMLPAVATLEDESSLYQGLSALAVRAAELGDISLALHFLGRKGSTRSGGDRTLETVYRLAPASSAALLIDRAREMRPSERASVLVELVGRVPARTRRPVIQSIVKDIQDRYTPSHERLHVMRALTPELTRLPISEIVSMWTSSLRQSATRGREEVLVDVLAFAPILAARFGREIALELDEAIRLGGVDSWP